MKKYVAVVTTVLAMILVMVAMGTQPYMSLNVYSPFVMDMMETSPGIVPVSGSMYYTVGVTSDGFPWSLAVSMTLWHSGSYIGNAGASASGSQDYYRASHVSLYGTTSPVYGRHPTCLFGSAMGYIGSTGYYDSTSKSYAIDSDAY